MTDDEIRALLDGATETASVALKLEAAWNLASTAPSLAAEVLRLREALREIADQASLPQQFYDRNGPTWTGKDGHEYEDTSAHLERCNELESIARAALKGAA